MKTIRGVSNVQGNECPLGIHKKAGMRACLFDLITFQRKIHANALGREVPVSIL